MTREKLNVPADTREAATLDTNESCYAVLAPDPLYRETIAASLLTVTIKTLQAWRVSGKGPRFIKLGPGLRSAVRYRRSDLLQFLADGERGNTSDHSARGAA